MRWLALQMTLPLWKLTNIESLHRQRHAVYNPEILYSDQPPMFLHSEENLATNEKTMVLQEQGGQGESRRQSQTRPPGRCPSQPIHPPSRCRILSSRWNFSTFASVSASPFSISGV